MPDPITSTVALVGSIAGLATVVFIDKVGIKLNDMVYHIVDKDFVLRPNSGTFQRKLPLLRVANARYGFPAPVPVAYPIPDSVVPDSVTPDSATPYKRELDPGEVDSDDEDEDEEDEKQPMRMRPISEEVWMSSPHIRAICEYARGRPGFLSYYWCRRFVILHYIFVEWLATIPADSYIREEGSYVPAFVELHLAHFRCGPLGRAHNRFRF